MGMIRHDLKRSNTFIKVHDKIINDIKGGMSYREACTNNGVSETCFYDWKRSSKEFADELLEARIEGKKRAVNEIENSLFKVACGYEVEETKTSTKEYADGRKDVTTEVTKKFIRPDTAAIIFALCNLAPDKWNNKNRLDFGAAGSGGQISIEFSKKEIREEMEKLALKAKN